jgi:hypothetical protein
MEGTTTTTTTTINNNNNRPWSIGDPLMLFLIDHCGPFVLLYQEEKERMNNI